MPINEAQLLRIYQNASQRAGVFVSGEKHE